MRTTILIALMMALPGWSQQTGRAVLGYVVDAVKIELRPVEGTTGAARMGAALELPEGVRRIDLAAGHDWALLDRGAGMAPLDLDLHTGVVRDMPLGEGGFSRVVSSPNGKRVALVREGRYEIWERNAEGFTRIAEGAIADHEAPSIAVSNTEPELAVALPANGKQAVAFDREGQLYSVTLQGELLDPRGTVLVADPELTRCLGLWAGDTGYVVAVSARRVFRLDLSDGNVTVEDLKEARGLDRWRLTGLLHVGGKAGEAVELYSTVALDSRRRWIPALEREGGAQ